MKPASLTITYTVYEPDYKVGMRYETDIKTLQRAKKIALKFGVGSDIVRDYRTKNKRGLAYWSNPRIWTVVKQGCTMKFAWTTK